MMSLIHTVQLDLSGAEISFAAPLSIYTELREGPVQVSDMFKLYRFENMLCTMELTGKEIDGFLEYAAGMWFNTMSGAADHLLLFRPGEPGILTNPYYNFSSAAGIDYTIDVSRPPGDRVKISGLSDGEKFSQEQIYRVAVNSYRGNGGGGHLTRGAGIPAEQLTGRVLWTSEFDLRYYLMQYLSKQDTLNPQTFRNWSCIPELWTRRAAESDRVYFQPN
jgi:2',3'-cyclic-nucleotide 2'-phosphodiesterase/3'-nucleotidase